jgi:hypothetical protein
VHTFALLPTHHTVFASVGGTSTANWQNAQKPYKMRPAFLHTLHTPHNMFLFPAMFWALLHNTNQLHQLNSRTLVAPWWWNEINPKFTCLLKSSINKYETMLLPKGPESMMGK